MEAEKSALVKTRQRACFLSPAIHAAGGAGFGNDDFREQRQTRFQVAPNPDRDVFAGGIFEPRNFVQIIMIETLHYGFERFADVGVIDQPAESRIHLAGHDDFDLETVAMQAAAFMRRWQIRQQVRRFKLKCFSKFDFHSSKLHFPVSPRHKLAKRRPAIVAPAQWRILHLADRTNSRHAPFSQSIGDVLGARAGRSEADRRNFSAQFINRQKKLIQIDHGPDVNEAVE